MKSPYDILIAPIVTEKSMLLTGEKKYTFEVDRKATKDEIRQAVEQAFEGVKVKRINTINMKGKTRRMGAHVSKGSDWKKAVVTLTGDSKDIEFFAGV